MKPYDGIVTIDGEPLADAITSFSMRVHLREGWTLTFEGPESEALARFFPGTDSGFAFIESGGQTFAGPLTVRRRTERAGVVTVEMFGAPPLQMLSGGGGVGPGTGGGPGGR